MCKLIKDFFRKRAQEKLKCEELCSTYLSRIDYLLESEQALFLILPKMLNVKRMHNG